MGLGTERAHTANARPSPQLTDWEQPGKQTITLYPKRYGLPTLVKMSLL